MIRSVGHGIAPIVAARSARASARILFSRAERHDPDALAARILESPFWRGEQPELRRLYQWAFCDAWRSLQGGPEGVA